MKLHSLSMRSEEWYCAFGFATGLMVGFTIAFLMYCGTRNVVHNEIQQIVRGAIRGEF